MRKVALITGITGQDGSYLSEHLLSEGYEVHGTVRRTSLFNRGRIESIREEATRNAQTFELHYCDLCDSSSINAVIGKVRPNEIYNLAAQSHVGISFQQPEYTTDVNALGVLRLLEAVRTHGLQTRFYQASTSELFGEAEECPQAETTPFRPRSPYGISKQFGYWIVQNYRSSYGLHASNGMLFNHESPRRGENFVTRKITLGLARLCAGGTEPVRLGNLDAQRDWGYARDYVEAMWAMLQQESPDDYVIATGEARSVRDFAETAARVAGLELVWEGAGAHELGRDSGSGRTVVEVDPQFYRPVEVSRLVGDPSKARRCLGWEPRVRFEHLVEIMMTADLALCVGA